MMELKTEEYENYRKDIVTIVAYLTGLKEEKLLEEGLFEKSIIEKLVKNENAKIIRALTILRMEYLRGYKDIRSRRNNLEAIESMSDLISVDLIKFLRDKGIETVFANQSVAVHIAFINQAIIERIDSIREEIPTWIRWEYIKSLFLMPGCYAGHNGSELKTQGKRIVTNLNLQRKSIANHKEFYPYGVYLNWPEDKKRDYYGNIYYNDEKFLKILYASFNDTFHANSYVIDATTAEKKSIYDFIESSFKIAILVDCENVDPYRFVAVFKNLEENNLKKIKKVVLYDDINTSEAWDYINEIVNLPIEHNIVERVLENKSLVDGNMIAGACREYYQENTESLILASSDSDFWGLIQNLPNARFYILNESDKTSEATIKKLNDNQIAYCFMDSFAQAEAQDFKEKQLYRILLAKIKEFNKTATFATLNPKELIDIVFREAHVTGAYTQIQNEKEAFYKRYIKRGLRIAVVEEGNEAKFEMELVAAK